MYFATVNVVQIVKNKKSREIKQFQRVINSIKIMRKINIVRYEAFISRSRVIDRYVNNLHSNKTHLSEYIPDKLSRNKYTHNLI